MEKSKLLTAIIELPENDPRIESLAEVLESGGSTRKGHGGSLRLFNATEAARMLNVSRSTLYRIRGDGCLQPVEIRSGCYRYSEDDLRKLVAGSDD